MTPRNRRRAVGVGIGMIVQCRRVAGVPGWIASVLLSGCATVAVDPYDAAGAPPNPAEQAVAACTLVDHLRCIAVTGRETFEDGRQLEFTRHWFRMSYIGRACERQYGPEAGVLLEALFAVPHYAFIGIGNVASALSAPFWSSKDEPPAPDAPAQLH